MCALGVLIREPELGREIDQSRGCVFEFMCVGGEASPTQNALPSSLLPTQVLSGLQIFLFGVQHFISTVTAIRRSSQNNVTMSTSISVTVIHCANSFH